MVERKHRVGAAPRQPSHAPGSVAWSSAGAVEEARYSFTFEVSRKDLEAFARYVGAFRTRAERACQQRLAALAVAARVNQKNSVGAD